MLTLTYIIRRGTILNFKWSFCDQYCLNIINLPTANHATADWGPPKLWGAGKDDWGSLGGLVVWSARSMYNLRSKGKRSRLFGSFKNIVSLPTLWLYAFLTVLASYVAQIQSMRVVVVDGRVGVVGVVGGHYFQVKDQEHTCRSYTKCWPLVAKECRS